MNSPSRRNVLYVEDHPVNALLMAAIFERRPGLDLVIAARADEALRQAARLRPTLLLLDLGLPDGHGSELLQQLRKVAGCEAAPAVAVTADVHFPALACGFTELWPKPLCVDDVLRRLDCLTGTEPPPPRELLLELLAPATGTPALAWH